MDAITILARCRDAQRDVERLQKRIRRWRSAMTDISAPPMDPDGGSHAGGETDRLPRQMADIDTLEEQLRRREAARTVETSTACALLDRLNETESDVLYGYYVRREALSAVAVRLKYSDAYVRRVKRSGDAALASIPEAEVNALLPDWYKTKDGGKRNE